MVTVDNKKTGEIIVNRTQQSIKKSITNLKAIYNDELVRSNPTIKEIISEVIKSFSSMLSKLVKLYKGVVSLFVVNFSLIFVSIIIRLIKLLLKSSNETIIKNTKNEKVINLVTKLSQFIKDKILPKVEQSNLDMFNKLKKTNEQNQILDNLILESIKNILLCVFSFTFIVIPVLFFQTIVNLITILVVVFRKSFRLIIDIFRAISKKIKEARQKPRKPIGPILKEAFQKFFNFLKNNIKQINLESLIKLVIYVFLPIIGVFYF